MRTVRFAEGLGDGIEEMGAVVRSYIDDPDKLFESGETLANTVLMLATLAGKINSILKCVKGSFTAKAMAYLEQHLTAEKGSRFLEVVRKLEKELGDKKTQLDTAKAKRIVESLDDGKSVDDVVAELKRWCEGVISETDRLKLAGWKYKPSDELYLKYKDVFDNPKYYNQKTGKIKWPTNDGFVNIPTNEILQAGTRLDRYGSDFGSFTSPEGVPYKMRSVVPGTDLEPYSVFEVVKPIEVKSGQIAPWFDEPGGGIQYLMPQTIEDLLNAGIIRRIK